ncbi:endonuclease-reverse transcriptase [Elysia marginata]|uniref:Endonuclease-reverse transcriptase n=1 Tax=Elysia marginata TaxID=1093978 RepID=A0AAV4GXX8_9GAST|nr:endonuclease-reverse transcriptase [Elysia marginata]
MRKNKSPGPDDITSDVLLIAGEPALDYLTKYFNEILKTGKIPTSWEEAKIIVIYKKGDPGDIKNYRPISLLSHSYKLFTRLLQTRMERILDENQPREQAGFRKGYSTTDRIHTLNQVIEKSNEYNLPLCVGFIDYEKAFDSVEHFAIFDALRQININEKCVNILENIYQNATAKVHIDNMESELFPIKRGVRQGDPISPKLFTAAIEMIFRKAELKHGLNIDGETLTNLRFADDVALVTEDTKSMEEQLNNLNKISLESGLQMHKGRTKYMVNFESHENIQIDKEKIEEVPNYKYLGQTTYLKETTKEEVACRIRAGWYCFGKNRENFPR